MRRGPDVVEREAHHEPESMEDVSEWLHALLQNRFRERTCAAQNEGAEVLVPVTRRRHRTCLNPFLQRQQINNRDPPLIDSLQQMMPNPTRQV
jgi:hypothetical protein